MPLDRFSIGLPKEIHNKLKQIAKDKNIKVVQVIRKACEQYIDEGAKTHQTGSQTHQTGASSESPIFWMDQISVKDEQIAQKDEQIKSLQSALDQSQQLQAMTEKRYETEHQQLIEMKARSFWQKLISAFE